MRQRPRIRIQPFAPRMWYQHDSLLVRDSVARGLLYLRGCLGNPVSDDADRLLEGVDILEVALRQPYLAGVRIDVLDLVAPLRHLFMVGSPFLQISSSSALISWYQTTSRFLYRASIMRGNACSKPSSKAMKGSRISRRRSMKLPSQKGR